MTAVERDPAPLPGGDPAVAEADHVGSTEPRPGSASGRQPGCPAELDLHITGEARRAAQVLAAASALALD